MSTYYILEENMPRLEKKMQRIQNKCAKYGCEFHFEIVGEEFREITVDGSTYTTKFIIVEAEGIAVLNGWRFVGTIDHHEEGNIIRQTDYSIDIPERFRYSDPVCEHCQTKRRRKNTCIVLNTETGEFRQVGNSCLHDYTCGFDADFAARYISWFDTLIQGETPYSGMSYTRYYNTKEMIQFSAEVYLKFGYQNSLYDYPTKSRVRDFYNIETGCTRYMGVNHMNKCISDMKEVSFNSKSHEAKMLSEAELSWIADQNSDNTYIHNLKTVCSLECIKSSDVGILVSIHQAYSNYLGKLEEDMAKKETFQNEKNNSQHQGQIGDSISFIAETVTLLSGCYTKFGYTAMYKLVDELNNVYIWKTGTDMNEGCRYEIRGKVKAHTEFQGVLQTEITRCRIVKLDNKADHTDINQYDSEK